MPPVSGGQRFSIIPAWAYDDERLSMSGLRMLGLLGTYSDPKGWSWPSQEELGGRLGGISQQAVSKAIREIHELGYIEIHYYNGKGSHKQAKYRIIFDAAIPDGFNRRVKWAEEKRRREEELAASTPGQDDTTRDQTDESGLHGRTTPELSQDARTTPRLSHAQPPGCLSHKSQVVQNVPSRTTPKNGPNITRDKRAPAPAPVVPVAPRSSGENAILGVLLSIPGFPGDKGAETTARLREYQADFPLVDFLDIAKSLRAKDERMKNGWLTVRNWADARTKRMQERGDTNVRSFAEYRGGAGGSAPGAGAGAAVGGAEPDAELLARLQERANRNRTTRLSDVP